MSALSIDFVLASPNLPSLPPVAMEVLELTRREDVRLDEIARVIQNDQALTTKILRTVNSSYYGLSKPCPTISRALALLGLSTVKSLMLGFTLVDVAKRGDGEIDIVPYWRRSLISAAAARHIATTTDACDPEEAFIGALMQDTGMLAIHKAIKSRYVEIIDRTEGDHRRLPTLEKEDLGFDHATIGALLGERWRLPPQLVAAIRHHHDAKGSEYVELVKCVALATLAASVLTVDDSQAALREFDRKALQWFKLTSADTSLQIAQIASDVESLSSLFDIDTGAMPDVNSILAEAEDATLAHQVSMQREHERLVESNDELSRQATTDGLTSVANRARFDQELGSRFDQARSFKGTLGLIIADLDHFKQVNDTHGHQAGDVVLVEVARRMSECVRGSDVVCRYGGEEFGIVLPGAMRREAAAIAERLRRSIAENSIDLDGASDAADTLNVTCSFGVAVYDPETAAVLSAPEILVQTADKALYAAKQAGRNCVRVHTSKPRAADAA
ncbi:MAG: sensor domain-containing diguanylate cyclase [Planctomycetota bacterium]|jgi:diguanylate cyclase (GGDEF)-like protein